LNDVEEIFVALVAYPEGPSFPDATQAVLVEALRTVCASLVGDTNRMPETTRLTVISVAASARADLPAGDGVSYSWGASAVDEALYAFEQRFGV
jgi:hypothetical protein